jgi:acid phosphatase
MRSVAMTPADTSQWNSLQWRRRLERFGEDDGPIVAAGPSGEVDGVWWVTSWPPMGRLTVEPLDLLCVLDGLLSIS